METRETKAFAPGDGAKAYKQTFVGEQETGGNQRETRKRSRNNSSTPHKWMRVLAAFSAGRSFNRFEAERQLNDHCLHSTVSTLQAMGVTINRRFETVPGYQGIPTRVCRYWLACESEERARKLLGGGL